MRRNFMWASTQLDSCYWRELIPTLILNSHSNEGGSCCAEASCACKWTCRHGKFPCLSRVWEINICWFPASFKKPHTAVTFNVPEHFHLLSLELKVSAFEFHQSLCHTSDNTGLNPLKQHLKMLKCTGCGHDSMEISNTNQGNCALLCPACPHPRKREMFHQYLYSLFVWRVVWKNSIDPGLSEGWAYFVEDSTYKLYLSDHANDIQELANGAGNLQKGERCTNMDYLFASVLRRTTVSRLNISYDITFLSSAHITPCQWKFSFNWTCGIGCTDDEAPECGWANINPIASSTKVMGPGSMILQKIKEAIMQRSEHQEDLEKLEKSLSQLAMWQQQVEDWEEDGSKPNPFKVKISNLLMDLAITQASIWLQLAKEEAQAVQNNVEPPLHPNITPSVLIAAGIDLEDQQWCLQVDLAKLRMHATDTQKAKFQQHSNTLMCHIKGWAKVHVLYVPGVAALQDLYLDSGSGKTAMPEDIPLYLPSQINGKVSCAHNLKSIKFQLHEGQANDVLNELHQALHSRAYMLKFKDHFLCGQGANTCAHNCLKNVDAKIDSSVAKYHAAYHVLCSLGPLVGKVGWKTALWLLVDSNICSMSNEDDQTSEGRQRLSWIWLLCGYTTGNTEARAHYWTKEVQLLFEEEQHMLQFLWWDAGHWIARAEMVTGQDKLLDEGLWAYAECQANLHRRFAVSFVHMYMA
ncbi:hypothetical protein J3A83DRAFT_4361090 [Scleroderma citrinum]